MVFFSTLLLFLSFFQAEDRVRRISSDLHCEILDLSGGENITELCKRKKKIKKTYSPRVSVEISVVSYTFQKPHLHVHSRNIKTESVSLLSLCVDRYGPRTLQNS